MCVWVGCVCMGGVFAYVGVCTVLVDEVFIC